MKIVPLILFFLSVFSLSHAQSRDSLDPKKEKIILPWFVERFKISAGAFYVVNNTNIKVTLTDNSGTNIDFEKDLGINKEIGTFLANFQWQISRRSRLSLNYFNVNRSSDHTLNRDIIFEDNTYYANSNVHTYFNTTIYQVLYGYAILSKPTFEAGLSIGTHIVNASSGISTNDQNAGIITKNSFGFTAPLPDLGIWGGWAVSNRFAINADISYFGLTLDNKNGRLLAFSLNLTYKILEQLNLSLGYAGLDFKVNVYRPEVTGNFKWGYNGPALAAVFVFGKKSWTH
jgi:hypothetical protein